MLTQDLLKELSGNIALQTQVLAALAGDEKVKESLLKHTAGSVMTANPLHGWNGLFSTPGLERDVITAHIRPTGIASTLPLIESVDESPYYGALTGYTAAVGSQPANACDDAPTGFVKGCNLTARYGRVRFDTNTIEMDKVMLRVNRGDFTDLSLRGRVLGLTDVGPPMSQDQILNVLTASEMVTVGVLFERELTRQMWQGSFLIPNEFPGLDVQIATGQKDAETGVLCPALDSDVKNFGYNLLSADIVTYLSMLEFYVFHNATRMGLMPATWVLVMRPELWLELTAIWPCAYNTNRCGDGLDGSKASVVVDGREMVAERDAMRAGMYLPINGRRYDVITDDGIFEHNNVNNGSLNPGEYASSIYMVPLKVVGNFPATYRNYVDYRKASADVAFLRGKESFWTDNGVYAWALEEKKWCYELAAKTEQRVVLRVPQLAGRIDAIKYVPLQHLRTPFPDDPYFADGGISIRPATQTPYAVWSGR